RNGFGISFDADSSAELSNEPKLNVSANHVLILLHQSDSAPNVRAGSSRNQSTMPPNLSCHVPTHSMMRPVSVSPSPRKYIHTSCRMSPAATTAPMANAIGHRAALTAMPVVVAATLMAAKPARRAPNILIAVPICGMRNEAASARLDTTPTTPMPAAMVV